MKRTLLCSISILLCCTNAVPGQRLIGTSKVDPLFQGVQSGDTEKIKRSLEAGADPNKKTPWGWAPLHQAMFARSEVCKLLLDAGADVNIRVDSFRARPSSNWTPLFFAVDLDRKDLVLMLLHRGAEINVIDTEGRSPLFYAIQHQHIDITNLLKNAGAKAIPRTPTPMPAATPAFYPKGLSGGAVSIPKLYQAVLLQNEARVKMLLDSGSDPNEKCPTGLAPLHTAMGAQIEISRLLLEHGADVNVRNEGTNNAPGNGWTPLFFAVYDNRNDLVTELLKYGAKVNITDRWGHSPLWYALDRKAEGIAGLLKDAGAKVN